MTGRAPTPVPVELRIRAFPALPPREVHDPDPFPTRVIIADVAFSYDGRAISGAYVGDGPDLDDVGGRFLGPAAPEAFVPPGDGPLRDLDGFLDHVIWRPVYKSRFGFVAPDVASFFCSLAFTFRNAGRWAIVFTDLVEGRRLVDYERSPILLTPLANGGVSVRFGPRRHPDPVDFVGGRQYAGRFASLLDATSALCGERVEDVVTACRLFDVAPPGSGAATPETLPTRVLALRELYRAVRREADAWL